MMQEPAGLTPQGQQAPTILPGQEALLAEALQPLQDPQGPPPPPLVLGGQPRMPSMNLPPQGKDSPPAMGLMNPELQPPPGLPPLEVPPVLPSDPAAASQLLEAIPIYLKNELARRDYQQHLDMAKQIQEGPAKAEGLRARMMLEPDDPGIDQEIEDSEPYLPKSTTERLKGSRTRRKALKSEMDSFDKELEEELRGTFGKSVVKRESMDRVAQMKAEIEGIDRKLGAVRDPLEMESQAMRQLVAKREMLQGDISQETEGGLEWGDVGRGLKGAFTNESSVEDSMLAQAKRAIARKYESVAGMGAPKIISELAEGRMPDSKPTRKLPEGVTPEMYRAALSEQAARTIGRIKGNTPGKDLVSAAAGTIPWMIGGAGEIAASAKVAKTLVAGSKLLQASPRIAKAAEVAITYVAGPAIAEGSIAAVQPLSPAAQNQVDQVEDPKLKEATEGAYRVLQVTQAATLASLFSISDVLRTMGGAGSLGKLAQNYVAKTSLGKTIGSTLGIAAAAPAMTELTNVGIEEVVAATRSGDVTKSDVLADMAQARNPALVGPARRLLQAKTADERIAAAKEYAMAAAPMAIGIGTIHAMSFAGAKLTSRSQKLELDRGAEKDIQAMVEKGDLDPQVGEVVLQKLRQETEQMAPTHAEDSRRATKETITEGMGQERGEARVLAERAAQEILPDVPGETVKAKLDAAVAAHDAEPDNPARQRDLEVAMRLEEAAAGLDREEAALTVASARRRAEESPSEGAEAPSRADLGDDALREMIAADEAAVLRPGETDAIARRVADEVTREWEIVHRDDESGDFTLRALDDSERIVVPERDLLHYKVADVEDVPRGTLPDVQGVRAQIAQPETKVRARDELTEAATQLVETGISSQRKLADKLGIGQRRAAALFQQLETDGVVVRDGKTWRLAPDRARRTETGEVTLSEAKQMDLERLSKEASTLIDDIGTAFLSTGATLRADEVSPKLGRLIVDFGDLARPDDPEAGSAALAGQLLRQLPEALRTDEMIVKTMGFPKEAVEMVRAAMGDPAVQEAAQAGLGDAVRPAGLDGPSRLDTRLAAKEAVTTPLLEPVREAYRAAREKLTEADAAEVAYRKWSENDLNLTVKTHAEFVKGEQREVDGILKRLVKGKKQESLDHLAERIRDLELQSEATALLSMTPEGRKVIGRLNDLRDAIFVGGAIPDHLLGSLETGAKPDPPRSRQGGFVEVPNFLGAGWQMLVSGAKRARMWLQIARRTMAGLFHSFKAKAGKAVMAGPTMAYRGLKTALRGGKKRNADWDLRNLLSRTQTVAQDEGGELLGGRNRGATSISGAVDNLSKWRESDAVLMVERASRGRAVAEELFHRASAVFPEDTVADARVARWLEAGTPEDRERIGKEFSPEQRGVLQSFQDFWKQTRELASKRLLPDQLIRENEYLPHLRTVRRRLETARDALRPPLQEALAARSKLPRPKKGEKGTPEWKEADRRVRQLQRAIKKFDTDIAHVGGEVAKIHGELEQIGRDWGIPDYSPHVMNRDPHAEVGWDGGVMVMPDPRELAARLHATEGDLREMARDWVPDMVPARLRSKHWIRRKGTGDPSSRDASYVRSMFHYLRELYRLAPAASWYENNRERLFGKMRVLENDEIDRGSVDRMDQAETGYRSRRVRWVDFGRGKSVRADQHFQLGGKVFTLTFEGPDGATKDVNFRTAGDLMRAREMGPEAFNLPKDWAVSEDQKYGHRILLLPDKSATASPDQRIRASETEVHGEVEPDPDADIDLGEVDAVTKQLHLPTHAQVHWPSEVYGRLSTTTPGKFHRIWQESGPESAKAFARYVQSVLDDAVGKHVLTIGQNVTAAMASFQRHKVLGLANPATAFKEMLDTTAMNATWLGADNAWEGAAWSMEFSKRLHQGIDAIDKKGLATWLKQHSLTEVDGQIGVLPPMLLEAVRTDPAKLAMMPADKRKNAQLQDEAFAAFLRSSLSGGSVMAMFTPTEKRYRYGEKVGGGFGKKLLRGADKASWWLRGRAQDHSMQQSWLASYMVARRGGLDDAAAYKQANLYALSSSLVANRASMAPALHTATGQLMRPMMSWVISQSSVNWRYLFHSSPDQQIGKKAGMFGPAGMERFTKLAAAGAARTATKLASTLASMYIVQQLGMLFGYDITRSIGQGLTEVPIVGKWANWTMHDLQAKMNLAATPDDAYKQLPAWRQKLVDQAKEHAPEWMREWLIQQAKYAGSVPADAPIFPMWGNWIPYAGETAKGWLDLFQAEFVEGDEKRARHLWYKNLAGNLWMLRLRDELYGTEPDPSDPNFVLLRNPATGVTNVRRRKGDWMRVAYNMIGSSVEDSVERIERSVLAPMRTEREAASTRSAAFQAGRVYQKATRARVEAQQTQDPGARAKLEQVAQASQREFMDSVREYARSHEMTPNETKALVKRWRRVADQNYLLTSAERDIINAYSSDMAFRLMANELNKVPLTSKPAMTQDRWQRVQSLWFTDADALRTSLKGASKDTREKFLRAYRSARERWSMQSEAEKAGIR